MKNFIFCAVNVLRSYSILLKSQKIHLFDAKSFVEVQET